MELANKFIHYYIIQYLEYQQPLAKEIIKPYILYISVLHDIISATTWLLDFKMDP